MADIEATTTIDAGAGDTQVVAAPQKSKKAKAVAVDKPAAVKKPKTKPNHPPTAEMVQNAIKSLKERGGSSLQAIKKYISATYKIDADKLSPFIKKYLKTAVTGGQLVQTKGKGASGSFRLPTASKPKEPKKKVVTATSKPKAVKKSAAKSGGGGEAKAKKSKAVAKKEAAIRKPVQKSTAEEKKKAAAPAKGAKKAAVEVKAAPKQKPTKPVKSDAAKKPKTPKPKKATGGAAKKAKK